MQRSLLIPMNTSITNNQALYIIENIREYFGYGK